MANKIFDENMVTIIEKLESIESLKNHSMVHICCPIVKCEEFCWKYFTENPFKYVVRLDFSNTIVLINKKTATNPKICQCI